MLKHNKCVLVNYCVYVYKWQSQCQTVLSQCIWKCRDYWNVCTFIVAHVGMQGDREGLAYCHAYEYTLL